MDHSAQRMSKAEWDAWRDQWYAYGSEKLTDDDIAKAGLVMDPRLKAVLWAELVIIMVALSIVLVWGP